MLLVLQRIVQSHRVLISDLNGRISAEDIRRRNGNSVRSAQQLVGSEEGIAAEGLVVSSYLLGQADKIRSWREGVGNNVTFAVTIADSELQRRSRIDNHACAGPVTLPIVKRVRRDVVVESVTGLEPNQIGRENV